MEERGGAPAGGAAGEGSSPREVRSEERTADSGEPLTSAASTNGTAIYYSVITAIHSHHLETYLRTPTRGRYAHSKCSYTESKKASAGIEISFNCVYTA